MAYQKKDLKIGLSGSSVKPDVGLVKSVYCRRCQRNRVAGKFYNAFDKILDMNGYMSVCSDCCNELLNRQYSAEMNYEKAFLKTCRILNIKYDVMVLRTTLSEIEKTKSYSRSRRNIETAFSYYVKNLRVNNFKKGPEDDLTFQNFDFSNLSEKDVDDVFELDSEKAYLQDTWGKSLELEDYAFLEERFAKWTRTTKCDTYAEELLVRELCHKENEIRKARIVGQSVDSLVKSLQEIMKNSALTPALQNAANSGRNADAFGVWIKDIENLEPAEWFEDQEKYRDIEGIEEYNEKYIKRSIKNFITGSRDFNVEGMVESDGDWEDD